MKDRAAISKRVTQIEKRLDDIEFRLFYLDQVEEMTCDQENEYTSLLAEHNELEAELNSLVEAV